MKILLNNFLLVIFIGLTSSYSITAQHTEKLFIGKSIKIEKGTIHFISLIEDSRCPESDTCFWEGQAKVLINIDGIEQEVLFQGNQIHTLKPKQTLKNGKTITGYRLKPYPKSNTKTKKTPYYLELIFEE